MNLQTSSTACTLESILEPRPPLLPSGGKCQGILRSLGSFRWPPDLMSSVASIRLRRRYLSLNACRHRHTVACSVCSAAEEESLEALVPLEVLEDSNEMLEIAMPGNEIQS